MRSFGTMSSRRSRRHGKTNGSRDTAWGWAERLAPMEPASVEGVLRELDDKVDRLARAIRNPGVLITCAMLPIRLMEVWDREKVMDALA